MTTAERPAWWGSLWNYVRQGREGLAALDRPWTEAARALAPGAPFLIGSSRRPANPEAWRAGIEEATGATVHLLDPEPDCPWLFAFGWAGERIANVSRRVLMTTHLRALPLFGGGEIQLLETLFFLRAEGVLADVSVALRLEPARYALVHAFSAYHNEKLEKLVRLQRPLVVSPIFLDYSEMFHKGTISGAIFAMPDASVVGRALDAWRQGTLVLNGPPQERFAEPRSHRKLQGILFERADRLLLLSDREERMIADCVGPIRAVTRRVPNAVRPGVFERAEPAPFLEHAARMGISPLSPRGFVLCAGRIEPPKNQAMLAWALRETEMPLVFAGRDHDPAYAAHCRRHAGARAHFVGALPPHLMASAYAAARVHALPSWGEVVGLATLEASLAGCGLVVTNRGGEGEYVHDYAHVSEPGDWRDIRDAVQRAWADQSPARSEKLRQHVLERYTWAHTARLLAGVYDDVVAGAASRVERQRDAPRLTRL